MTTVRCLCGEEHLLPDDGRVWFLHPSNMDFATGLLERGEAVNPCAIVPRQQAINLDAKIAASLIGADGPHTIVEEAAFP